MASSRIFGVAVAQGGHEGGHRREVAQLAQRAHHLHADLGLGVAHELGQGRDRLAPPALAQGGRRLLPGPGVRALQVRHEVAERRLGRLGGRRRRGEGQGQRRRRPDGSCSCAPLSFSWAQRTRRATPRMIAELACATPGASGPAGTRGGLPSGRARSSRAPTRKAPRGCPRTRGCPLPRRPRARGR